MNSLISISMVLAGGLFALSLLCVWFTPPGSAEFVVSVISAALSVTVLITARIALKRKWFPDLEEEEPEV